MMRTDSTFFELVSLAERLDRKADSLPADHPERPLLRDGAAALRRLAADLEARARLVLPPEDDTD